MVIFFLCGGGGGGHHKIGFYLGIISMHFRFFLEAKVQNGGFLGSC